MTSGRRLESDRFSRPEAETTFLLIVASYVFTEIVNNCLTDDALLTVKLMAYVQGGNRLNQRNDPFPSPCMMIANVHGNL